MPDSTSRLGVELLSTKTSVDKGQLLTDNQLATAIRGFEEGGFKEAKHAAGIISRGKTTEEVWEATREHLLDVLEDASVVGPLDEDLPRAACQAARVVAKTSSNTSIDPPTKTDLGESLIRDGTSDDGSPWLTTAGIFLLSAAMETTDYDPADEFAKRIAEHLLALSKKTDGTREANLAAAGYSVLGRMSEGDHARILVAEGVDIRQYLLRTESNFREGFVRFAAQLAEEDPGLLEPYTVELATHLRADSYTVRRDAARAFAALCGEVDWETLRPGTITLDGPFENDGPIVPLFALQFLQRVAVHKPEVIPTQIGEAFARALRRDERFTSLYGSEGATAEDMGARAMLFYVLETLAPRFPELVEAAGDGVFDELLEQGEEEVTPLVSAAGGCFAAVDPEAVGDQFVQFLVDGLSADQETEPMDTSFKLDASTRTAVSRFITRMAEFEVDKALSTAERLVTLAERSETPEQLAVVGSVLLFAHQERDDDELATNFRGLFERVADGHEDDFPDWSDDVLEKEAD